MLVTANIFQPLIDVFESVLKFFHNSGGFSWGLSIVLLTVAVRAVLVPLTFRQIKSMVRMQSFAPQLKEIQQKYKEDRQKQSEETMKFYRENNINPLGSCLPLVLQLPVFVSLYYMLRQSLRADICPHIQAVYQAAHHTTNTTPCGPGGGAHFLFISDLTDKATGVTLIILIILYVGSQLGSTLVMSAASTMDPNQRRMMLFLPVIFVLFVFRFPAGVLVYWITTNVWTMAQQWVVAQRIRPRLVAAHGGPVDSTASPPSGGKAGSAGARPASRKPRGPGTGSSRAGAAAKANAGGEVRAAADGGGAGSGAGAGTAVGGIAALFRGRQQDPSDGSGSAEANGANGNGSDRSKSGVGSGSRPGRASRGTAAGSSSGGSKGPSSSGGGPGAKGASASSSSDGAGAKPPPPPRKRKKRSGRRR